MFPTLWCFFYGQIILLLESSMASTPLEATEMIIGQKVDEAPRLEKTLALGQATSSSMDRECIKNM